MQEYNKTDQYIHQLAQTLAKFNRSYAERKEDDSHTNLAYDSIGKRLLGCWVETPKRHIIMALNLSTFTFEILDSEWNSLLFIETEGKTQSEIEKKIELFLPELGLEANSFTKELHFQITKYPFKDLPFTTLSDTALLEWSKYRIMANNVCQALLNHLQVGGETRIWPHHFDTGIYVNATSKVGLGFGLAMSDDMIDVPYFYHSAYGLNGFEIDYPALKKIKFGEWKIEKNWKGAILKLPHANLENLSHFLKETTSLYLNH